MRTENMKICIVSFTKKGYELSCDIANKLEKSEYEVEGFYQMLEVIGCEY